MNYKSNLYSSIIEATNSIYTVCKQTPLKYSSTLSELTGIHIYIKKEYKQHTGSFKLRGATYKLQKIFDSDEVNSNIKEKIIVSASTGNHGIAVSYASKKLNENKNIQKSVLKSIIYSPYNVDESKVCLIKKQGAELNKVSSNNCLEAEISAKEYASNTKGAFYISPYNDCDIIAGQGTIGYEILKDLDYKCDAIFVSVGGGGLIGGISEYVKNTTPDCIIVGCQPFNSRVIYESLKDRKVLQDLPELETFSDGTAGGVEEDTLTFPIIQKNVDEFILADEKEISDAFCMIMELEKIVVEGSAALTLACLLKNKEKWQGKRVCIVLCGGNISLKKVKDMIEYSTKN